MRFMFSDNWKVEWSSSTFEKIIRIENDLDRLEQWPEVNSREFNNDRESKTLFGSSAQRRGENNTQS